MRSAVATASLLVMLCPVLANGEVLVVKSTTKVLKSGIAPQGMGEAMIEAARNEYEGFQLVVRAIEGPLKSVTVEIWDLQGPDDAVIQSDSVQMFLENYVHVEQPSACFEFLCPDCYKYPEYLRQTGDYPEQMVPFYDPYSEDNPAVAVPFDVGDGDLQTVWVDIHVPTDAQAGEYVGAVTVRSGENVLAEVPVHLTVWDFEVSSKRNVATAYGFSTGSIKHFHGGPDGPDQGHYEQLLKNYEFEAHRHRMDYTTHKGPVSFEFDEDGNLEPVDFTAYDEYIGPRVDGSHYPDGAGLNRFNLGMFRPGHGTMGMTDDQFAIAAKGMAEHLQEKGWLDHVYLYSTDEPWLPNHAGAFTAIKETHGLLDRYTDLWKGTVLVTGPWMKIIDEYVDIWCPVTPMYGDCLWPTGSWPGPDKYQELMAQDRELWFYVCNANFPPVMGYDTDSPIGWEPRLTKWGAWAEGATGFLYWRINYWQSPDPWNVLANFAYFGDMYSRHGDGILLYPGDHNGTKGGEGSPDWVSIDGPVVSFRMKQVRDGLEDWEMLIMASELGAEAWVREQVGSVYRKFGEPLDDAFDISDPPWTLDEDALHTARRNIALKIQYLLHPDEYDDPESSPVPEPESWWGEGMIDLASIDDVTGPEAEPMSDAGDVVPGQSEPDTVESDSSDCSAGGAGALPGLCLALAAMAAVFVSRRRV